MDRSNMLTASKVKQHGLTSEKWTTKDKIVQYKGLINLYTRDKKIMEMNIALQKKKQAQEMKTLQTEINLDRKKLDNACAGDNQKLRNALSNHRTLQLAYCNSTPTRVIDLIHQVSFTKRKKRDILRYRQKVESDKLIDLKLNCAVYEDRLKYEGDKIMLPSEKEAHLITGRIQDAILKKEAAIYIRNSYKEMIAIMKKDAIYFDAILASLKNDGIAQGRCIINATLLGHVGMEYLNTTKQEYHVLERVVKMDLASRKKDIASVQQNVEAFTDNLKNLIRSDSDINLGKISIKESPSFHLLQKEIETIESTLRFLKDTFFLNSFDQIFPCLKEQMRQRKRLDQLVHKCEANRDDLMEKSEKAAVLCATLQNTMVETTKMYNSDKTVLKADIKFEIQRTNEYEATIKARYNLLAKIRIALRHLQYLARLLSTETESTIKLRKMPSLSSALVIPEEDEVERPTRQKQNDFTTTENNRGSQGHRTMFSQSFLIGLSSTGESLESLL
ncbi:unnamed protein product [Phyllotreta striolata]|uniref:Uncharacterized protein n=1 Tax=Phyllotreta striolata TaxID=444603 RepID=A0A9N9TFB5_PHYSR|nr:unnamed protein product [Phyllotreta striolata]